MAQVIRKYLEGGKSKSTIVKVDGKDYNYDDIEKNVWGNFEAHAKAHNWDAATQAAVRDYLEYSLAGLKSGELTYGHNKMNNVSEEYESDGTLNTSGKGLFKKNITSDKRAGATLGTAFYNDIFNNVMLEYTPPELKSINVTNDIALYIMNNNFGGSREAMVETWNRLSPRDRYTIFGQAVAGLNYDPNEYKDVELFNNNRRTLLLALEGGLDSLNKLSSTILDAYSRLGGSGLDNLINGVHEQTAAPLAKSILQHREEWKLEAISNGYETPQAIQDYITLRERLYNQQQLGISAQLQQFDRMDSYNQAYTFVNDYIRLSKEKLAPISSRKYSVNWKKLDLNPDDKMDLSNLNPISLKNRIHQLSDKFKLGLFNPYEWRGLLSTLLDNGMLAYSMRDGSGEVYIIPGSEDMNTESVIVFDGESLSLKSIHDFPDIYGLLFNLKFRNIYRQHTGIDLPTDWVNLYSSLSSALSQLLSELLSTLLTSSYKTGGIIKMQDGAAFMQALAGGNQTSMSNYELSFYNLMGLILLQKRTLEIEEANELGLTVEEFRRNKSEQKLIEKHRSEKIFGNDSLSADDYLRIGSLLLDVAALGTSFAPGYGSLASGVLGTTSAATDFVADMVDKGVTTGQMFGNLLANLGFAGVGMLPGGKAGTVGAKILKWAPRIVAGIGAGMHAQPFINAVNKGRTKGWSNLSREDWKDIYYGIKIATQGGAGAVRDVRAKSVKGLLTQDKPGKTTITTSDGESIDLNPKLAEELSGMTVKKATEKLRKTKGSDGKPLLGEDLTLDSSTWNKIKSKLSLGKLGSVKIEKQPGTMKLMSPEEVTAKFNGQLPASYVDLVLRDPSLVTPEQYTKILNAARNSGYLFAEKMYTPENMEWIRNVANNINPALFIHRFLNELNVPISGIKQYGRVNSPFEPAKPLPKLNLAQTQTKTKLLVETLNVTGNLKQRADKLNRILNSIKKSSSTERKAPSLLDNIDAKSKSLWSHKDSKDIELVAFVNDAGLITLINKKAKGFKDIDKSRLLSIKTQVETSEGRMSISDAFAKGKQIKFDPNFLKFGGILLNNVINRYLYGGEIPKYATGNLFGNIIRTSNSDWLNNVYALILSDLLKKLNDAQTPEEKLKVIDLYNDSLRKHSELYRKYTINGEIPDKASYGDDIKDYQNNILNNYNFLNQKGINTLWRQGAYGYNYNRNPLLGGDGYDFTYGIDGLYGSQTDDRRILGRKGDFSDDYFKQVQDAWKQAGADIYLDEPSGYYMLKLSNSPSTTSTTTNTITGTNSTSSTTDSNTPSSQTVSRSAIGNGEYDNTSRILKIGQDVWKYVQNINPADAIALGRALWGENVNNRVANIAKKMGTALSDPQYQSAILHGNYTAKMLGQLLAGKIMAAGAKPISSDAGLLQASNLEAAIKAQLALQQYNAEDSEMYWKTLQILNQVNNENAAQKVITGNENRGKVVAAANNRLQAEAARLAANFEQIWQPYLSGIELNYRNEDTLRRQAELDSWKYKVTSGYQSKLELLLDEYRLNRALAAKNWTGTEDDFETYWATNKAPEFNKKMQEIYKNMYDELYNGLSLYYRYNPFILSRPPEATPGINEPVYKNYASKKLGGTLSAADRLALKTTNEINKNIRAANRETFKNIRDDKKEHRKALALVSQLSADLIKKAVGII